MNEISDEMAAAAGRTYRGATIAWGRGECYDFDAPNPEVITLEDIAYALAFTPRWRGQTRFAGARCFFGVGQHCVFGADRMMEEGHGRQAALDFLLHELDEVVLPDFPGPAKNSVPGFREFAKRQGEALGAHLGHRCRDADLIKRWDMRMMVTEKRDLMPGHEADAFHTSDRVTIDEVEFPAFATRIVPAAHPELAARDWLAAYYRYSAI